MNNYHIFSIRLCSLLALIFFVSPAAGVTDLSDAQKLEVVYRMYDDYKKDFPTVSDISPQKAMALFKQGKAVFVDTRKPDEMAVSTLPAAVTKKDFVDNPGRYRNKTVVAYCTISYRSGVFARNMGDQDVTVVNLRGGILAWLLEGGQVVDRSGRTVKRVHVYGDKWDYAPAGYESITFSLWEQVF